MSKKDIKKQPSRDWLLKMATVEDAFPSVAVGGMAEELGMLPSSNSDYPKVLNRLIELARRKMGYSVEKLAQVARVDLKELVKIEEDDAYQPAVRTVYQLATTLKLPAEKLLELAGLVEAESGKDLNDAAILFAARSETNAKLTSAEKDALEEFVKVLVEGSD